VFTCPELYTVSYKHDADLGLNFPESFRFLPGLAFSKYFKKFDILNDGRQ